MMMMTRFRLIKSMVSSTLRGGRYTFHGSLMGACKEFSNRASAADNVLGDIQPDSLIRPWKPKSADNVLGEIQPGSLICPWMSKLSLSECDRIFGLSDPTASERLGPGFGMSDPTSYEILGPGMILIKNYVSFKDQVDIVNICEKWGVSPEGYSNWSYQNVSPEGFSNWSYQNGADIRQHMCFGRKWDHEAMYKKCDGPEPPPLPHELVSLAKNAIQDAQARLDGLPSMCPDHCLVSFYEEFGRLGLHQDLDESSDSLERGLPVVSISIGDIAEFMYGDTSDENKLKTIWMESGDILIFGGKSRLVHHGVSEIFIGTGPAPLKHATAIRKGYLNLTIKQF